MKKGININLLAALVTIGIIAGFMVIIAGAFLGRA